MSKYKFSTSERFVIWKAYDNKCFWCGKPLEFKEITIDHLFPENLISKSDELEKIKRVYSLPSDFTINDFCNWVPAHGKCNAKKSIKVLKNSPMFLLDLERVQGKTLAIKQDYNKLSKQVSKDKVIARLLTDLEKGNISNNDLLKLFESTSVFYYEVPDIQVNELAHLPEGWKVMSFYREEKKMKVTNGSIAGMIPTEIKPHPSWLCSYCYKYGPWDGNRCCNCGHYCYPD